MMHYLRNNVELTTSLTAAKDLFDQARITRALRKGSKTRGENTRTAEKRCRNRKQTASSSEHDIQTATFAETPPPVPHPRPSIPRQLLQISKTTQMKRNPFAHSSGQLVTDVQARRRIHGTRHEVGRMTSTLNHSVHVKKTKFRAEWTGNRTRKKSISMAKNNVRISHRASKTMVSLETNKTLKNGRAIGLRTNTAVKNIARNLELVKNLLALPSSCIRKTNEMVSLKKTESNLANTNAASSITIGMHKSTGIPTNRRTPHKQESDSQIVGHGVPGSGSKCCALPQDKIVKYEESELLQLEIALQNALMHVESASSLQRPLSPSSCDIIDLAIDEQAGEAQSETKDRIDHP
uniref:AlNc14C84G5428 protein n=1 Tax=Albugo laibachii Nc14 TaxID=890382 RepID=F0WFP4_9STRA|nr:AlNc14C84G5428 [Albugo laibachii Nc14]|eukprot:CCA20026.1 AlNc14C84G5428 [Albugo laibachii Nc14]